MEENRKINRHRAICQKLTEIYRAKNKDYGDSFAIVRHKHHEAIIIRLMDKLLRLESLYTAEAVREVEDESIEDTLEDLANYCIMELIEREIDDNGAIELELTKKKLDETLKKVLDYENMWDDAHKSGISKIDKDTSGYYNSNGASATCKSNKSVNGSF